jgi:agmatine deiminase
VDFIFNDPDDLKRVELELGATTYPVCCHHFEHNDIWIRDYGPLFMNGSEQAKVVKFGFNAWGGKFPPFDLDVTIPSQIADHLKLKVNESSLIVEGGAFEFNGNGLALSTLPCLIGENRNPGLDLSEIEQQICSLLNLDHLFLFSKGLVGDHTDGHVDNVARFIDPQTLLVASALQNDPQSEVCEVLYEESLRLKEKVSDLKIIQVPLPAAKIHQGEILSRSYLNFIFVNGAMIVPTFNEQNEKAILNSFQNYFPDRQVIGVDCRELIYEGGGLHCMTCHQPFQSH